MKDVLSKTYLVVLIIFLFFLFTNCGTTPQIPKEVCVYTNVICEFSETICDAYPESCWYVNIVCVNLSVLCDTTSTSSQKEFAMDVLKESNMKFQEQLKEIK